MKVMRWNIINWLINGNGYSEYLEIGLFAGKNFNKIKCKHKASIDPSITQGNRPTHKMMSDEFFKQNKKTFDIVFVDGLHHCEQVYKDVVNSLECLNFNGVVVCHDMNPPTKVLQTVPRKTKTRRWFGDCWKAFVRLRAERDDLSMCVIDADCGIGIIQRGQQEKLLIEPHIYNEYENFAVNRKCWLNLMSFKEFQNEK